MECGVWGACVAKFFRVGAHDPRIKVQGPSARIQSSRLRVRAQDPRITIEKCSGSIELRVDSFHLTQV